MAQENTKYKLPQLASLLVNFSNGYMGGKTWIKSQSNNKHEVLIGDHELNPSLEGDILYINNISAEFNKARLATGEYNTVQKAQLSVIATGNVEVLLDPVSIDVTSVNFKRNQIQTFIDSKTPLFRLKNISVNQQFFILFQIIITDEYNNRIPIIIHFRFPYNVSTLTGDINGDGKVDLFDVVLLSDYINSDKAVKYPMAGDFDGDGKVNILDVIKLSNMVLNNG